MALAVCVAASGCATMRDSMLLGVGSGAAVGAGTGMIVSDDKGSGAWKGALIGAGVGAISSYFIHNALEKRDSDVRRETLLNLEKFGISSGATNSSSSSSRPMISMPVVEEQYVDTTVKGKKLEEGHKVWVITEDPSWVTNDNKAKNEK